ncbi:MAG TPA: Trm112 family protein [Pyrinomonadaceae bacterium]|nr:Trm112 family protein [Pyrinomonadaceae bacterium]
MKITEEFVEMMICPACQSKVRLKEDGSAIKCVSCRRAYPIEDDMPMMLPDKATIEDEGATPAAGATTPSA